MLECHTFLWSGPVGTSRDCLKLADELTPHSAECIPSPRPPCPLIYDRFKSLGVCTIRQSNVTSHLQVVRLSLWSLQKFLPGWSSRHRGPPTAPLCKHSPSRSHLPSLSSTGLGSGATCLRGGRTPTVPEEDGCVGHGAAWGQDGCCRGTEGLQSMTGAGRSGRVELACCLAVAAAPSLFGC